MYNDDGNDNRVVRNGCGDRDDSFNYNNIYSSMHQWYKNKSASLDEDSDSNVRKQHGQRSSKEEAIEDSNIEDVDINDVDEVEEDRNKSIS